MGLWRIVVIVLVCVVTTRVKGRVVVPNNANDVTDGTGGLWQPPNGRTREDFLKYHGQTPDEMERVKQKMAWLKMSRAVGVSHDTANANQNQATVLDGDQLEDDCIWLEETQVDDMLSEQREADAIDEKGADSKSHRRPKRWIQDFENYPRRKWTTMPIRYKFDGEHSEFERNIIRGVFDHWMAQTCVLFEELPTDADYEDNHILITRRSTGCHSYVGKVTIIPQQLNLQSSCLLEFGIPVHEIGHSLGLWHLAQRSDRDDYIRINWENRGSYVGQFYKNAAGVDLGVPFDFGSVMHYSPKTVGNNRAIESLDPQYQGNMGQRTGLSFLDAKIINLAYCSDKCANKTLGRPCDREGYQDPKDCSKCICPDGFSGKYCEDLEPAFNAQCGGELMATTSPQTIKTPGYDSPRYYDNFEQCNWHIKAPANYDIIFKFEDEEFGIYCHRNSSCYHWAEVRYKNSLGQQGPRFCCYRAPDDVIRGQLGEMMVIFKTNFSVPSNSSRRGFKASFYAVSNSTTEDFVANTPNTTNIATMSTTDRRDESTTLKENNISTANIATMSTTDRRDESTTLKENNIANKKDSVALIAAFVVSGVLFLLLVVAIVIIVILIRCRNDSQNKETQKTDHETDQGDTAKRDSEHSYMQCIPDPISPYAEVVERNGNIERPSEISGYTVLNLTESR